MHFSHLHKLLLQNQTIFTVSLGSALHHIYLTFQILTKSYEGFLRYIQKLVSLFFLKTQDSGASMPDH